MKLLSIAVCRADNNGTVVLCQETDVSDVWWGKSSIKQVCTFTVREVSTRIEPLTMKSLKYKEHICHAYKYQNGLVICAITDNEYDIRSAHIVLKELYKEFEIVIKPLEWMYANDFEINFKKLPQLLQLYKLPPKSKMDEIEDEVDKSKQLVVNALEQMIERGEKLDDLIAQSNDLSEGTKLFVDRAKKLNKCRCIIL